MNIPAIVQSKNIKNSFWLIGEQIFQMLINMIVGVLSARYLGPSGYGLLNYTASFVSFFAAIASLGMDNVVIKRMIEDPTREGEYLGSCTVLRLLSSFLSILAIMLLIMVLNPGEPITLQLAFLQSLQLSFQSIHILNSWFQRHLKSKYVSVGNMIACVVVSAYKVYLLAASKSVLWFALSHILTSMIMALIMYGCYRKEKGQPLTFRWQSGRRVLEESYHYILSRLMVAIYTQMDKIMIGQMLTDTDVGLYATATSICGMWTFVPNAIINSFRPMIMELKVSGKEELYQLRLRQLYSAVIWICIAASAVISIIAKWVVYLLYGTAYAGALQPLRIAIWFETFAMVGTARGVWILSEDKSRFVKYYLSIGAVVNLLLNAYLIPVLGIDGAAWATLVTQIVTSLIAPLFFEETRIHTRIVLEAFVLKWYFVQKRKEKH